MRGLTVRCPRCSARLERDASFCTACGAPSGRLEVEVDGPAAPADGHEVVFERPRRRGRLVAGALLGAVAVAVVANALTGGGDATSSSTSTTTGSAARTVAGGSTTTVRQPVTIARGPLLGETTGLTLLVVGTQDVYRLELDTALLTALPDSVPYDDVAPVRGGFLGWTQGAISLVPSDGRPARRLVDGGQLLGEGPAGRQWFFDYQGSTLLRTIDAVDHAPETVNLTVEQGPFYAAAADGLGGVVGPQPGGVFRWFPGGASVAVAPGELMDARNGFALTRQCYPGPDCSVTVTDLRTARATIAAPYDGQRTRPARVSPDGRWLVLGQAGDDGRNAPSPSFVLHRVADGAEVTFPTDYTAISGSGLNQRSGVAWSSDGRWLFTVTGSRRISAWREGLAQPVTIDLPDAYLQGPLAVELPG